MTSSHPNKIIIKNKLINGIINGTSVSINVSVPENTNNNTCLSYNLYSDTKSLNSIDLSNRIILSGLFENSAGDIKVNLSLLTQRNLNHNMNFHYHNNDFTKPRLIFKKYETINNHTNNNKFLFDNINNWVHNNLGYREYEFIKFLNYYKNFNNSDYYKFNLGDFIDVPIPPPLSIDDIKIKIKGVSINNEFDPKYINYDENNFSKILYYNNADICNNINDISNLNIIDFAIPVSHDNSTNFLLYNKLHNLSTLQCDFINSSESSNYTDVSINFFLTKGYNHERNYESNSGSNQYGSKILLNKDFTSIDSRIIGENSNIPNIISDNSNTIFLSCGNSICGLTRKNIFNNVKFEFEDTSTNTGSNITNQIARTKKILFYNETIISKARTLDTSLLEFANADYLLDNSYNYDYVNTVYNNIQTSNTKNIDLNLSDFYYSMNHNNISLSGELLEHSIYKKRFKTLELLNTASDITNSYFDNSLSSAYDFTKNNYFIKTNDISYNSNNYKIKFNNELSNAIANNQAVSFSDISAAGTTSDNLLNYDFRFNYNKKFYVEVLLNLQYELINSEILDASISDILIDYKDNLLLNFHKIVLTSYFETTAASDFTNIDCIFVYHNPKTTTDPSYLYPNNNIQIITDSTIDTLTKAIALLPDARTSTSNSVFIPARNGSNLSRKMIQGLIGLNDIPKLLSIQPYNPDTLTSRGFINQYQITDDCLTEEEQVKAKINATKHDSVKQKRTFLSTSQRKQNYANLVRSNARNNLSKTCSDSLEAEESTTEINYINLKKYTPFKLFKTGKGNYLGSN
tara:strand:- start:7097 stop:9505 length:2409 start_codon:yes stop_codon:yes gene_type:complete